MTVASYITISRILLIIPIIYLTHYQDELLNWISLFLFIAAGMSDYLDGYIARKTNTETSLGALLDLLADKLLVCLVLLWLVFLSGSLNLIFPALIIISRELIISTFRQYLVERLGKNPVKVSFLAKTKTTLQIVSISFLIISPNFGDIFFLVTVVIFWLAAYISIHTLFEYFVSYKNLIK